VRTLRRPQAPSVELEAGALGRLIVLATLGVPFESEATEFAVDTAVESGRPLVLLNVVELILTPQAVLRGSTWELHDEQDARALAEPALLAASLGVSVERLRVCSPHPVDALVQTVAERDAGLLVFGPDRSRLRARRYRKAAKAIRDRVSCLVWLPD
jgi:nucleotide-binding universal stress UspA family protein